MADEPRWFRGPSGAVFTAAPDAAFTEKYMQSLVDSGEWEPIGPPEAVESDEPPTPAPVEPKPEVEKAPAVEPAVTKRRPGRPRKNTAS